MTDALTQQADEGRARLRKASESCQEALLSGDVRMGKPTLVNPECLILNT
jgi:hypothetical protein